MCTVYTLQNGFFKWPWNIEKGLYPIWHSVNKVFGLVWYQLMVNIYQSIWYDISFIQNRWLRLKLFKKPVPARSVHTQCRIHWPHLQFFAYDLRVARVGNFFQQDGLHRDVDLEIKSFCTGISCGRKKQRSIVLDDLGTTWNDLLNWWQESWSLHTVPYHLSLFTEILYVYWYTIGLCHSTYLFHIAITSSGKGPIGLMPFHSGTSCEWR